ncbi:hypothetical protein [Aureivirga marina]|uniref:hypothetical protein n=1 Tax=Aureivirga marina TaxID=1182451 RepID=UPI0018C92BAF|nr:hypothetical protein [Aureivirga marina]
MKSTRKVIYSSLILFLFIFSCTTIDDGITRDKFSPIGKWKLIAFSNTPEVNWIEVEDGYEFNLLPNYTFESEKYESCPTGHFELINKTIHFDYDCTILGEFENAEGKILDSYYFDELDLVLTPKYGDCQNICFYKFERIEGIEEE